MTASCALNVAALDYGEEWESYTSGASVSYKDVPSYHWAHDAISRVSAKNWFNGYPDNKFHPDDQITRSEAMKVLVQFIGLQLSEVSESSYSDVDPEEWYAPYIEAGKDLFPANTAFNGETPFQPDMPIIREDVVYALVKALGFEDKTQFVDQSVLNMFKDKNSISSDIKPYMAVAVSNELVAGFDDDTIRAQDPLTRAEFATLLYRGTFIGSRN